MELAKYILKFKIIIFFIAVSISKIASEGFDPPTSGLWAQHASAAPTSFFTVWIFGF